MTQIDLIITTASGDPHAVHQLGEGGLHRMPIGERAKLLDERILPAAVGQGLDNVIVVGRSPKHLIEKWSDDVHFIDVPPLRRERIEAFRQREIACRMSTADIFIMCADDHALDENFVQRLREILDEDWSFITPKRIHDKTGEELNNGKAENYSPWHCQVLRREVWSKVPWTTMGTLWSDIVLTSVYRDIGAKMEWRDDLVAIDVEASEEED